MTIRRYGSRELERDFGRLNFANALESYRLGEEMTQKEFAKLLQIAPQSLCDLEKGRRIPSPGRAAKIAKKLKQPVASWVQLALQDVVKRENLKLTVSVA